MKQTIQRTISWLFLTLAACPGGGAGDTDTDTSGATGSGATDSATATSDPTEGAWQPASCFEGWDQVSMIYPDAGALVACTEVPGGLAVVRSLLVLDGITIDNQGQAMSPCVEARCDETYAYVGSNALPHYDFVQTTPNPLVASERIYRVPLAPTANAGAEEEGAAIAGCVDAYAQHLSSPGQATQREPSGNCVAGEGDVPLIRDALASGESSLVAKLACLGVTGFMINGAPIFGPNEAGIPDPFGSPFFAMPDSAGEPYLSDNLTDAAALDLCGGHTADVMHYHAANQACFEQGPDGAPAASYAVAAQAWEVSTMLAGACEEESPIVGWSLDGYPIKGPCACVARDGEGACTEVRRARSSWIYAGLGAWGDDPQEAAALAVEGAPCEQDADCCEDCDFRCSYVPVAEGEGTAIARRCTLLDYSWCTHRWVDRSAAPEAADFVYLDRCNGREGPDGYAYHATASFPYVTGCFRGAPQELPMSGGGMMGMDPPKCMPGQTMMCCGDGACDGPETAQNCAEDC